MAIEIELKARVRDSDALRRRLGEKADYLYAFEKEDTYWNWREGQKSRGVSPVPEARLPSGPARPRLRIRNEKRALPDGRTESFTLATYKKKRLKDGVEINDEREFSVNPVQEFEAFLVLAGLKPETAKQKRGWAFSRGGITAELLEVPPLGWFLELEIITGDRGALPLSGRSITPPADGADVAADSADNGTTSRASEEVFAEARKRLLDFLRELGITEKAIESRFYSELLKETESRKAPL